MSVGDIQVPGPLSVDGCCAFGVLTVYLTVPISQVKVGAVMKTLARGVGLVGSATALFVLFGSGSAAAINDYVGQTYNDAATAISQAGQSPVISTREGSFLPTGACIVSGSRTASSLDSSGNSSSRVLLDLNCNYMFALPGVPGNSLASPEGRAARAAAEKQLAEQQAQAQQNLETDQQVADSAVNADVASNG